jgi:predicted transcriptional regulator
VALFRHRKKSEGPGVAPPRAAQAALAKRARLTRVYIIRLEAGQQDPSLSTINALARALRITASELLE